MSVATRAGALASALLILGPVAPALAAPFPVTTTADSGPGSLRAAIEAANAAPGTDDISFAIPANECSPAASAASRWPRACR